MYICTWRVFFCYCFFVVLTLKMHHTKYSGFISLNSTWKYYLEIFPCHAKRFVIAA